MTKIRELRISREISQKEFAEAIGVPANTLCQWETGKRAPDYEMLKKISAYFGVSVDYLLDNNEPAEATSSSLLSGFGKLMKQVREQKGITVEQMACDLGTTASLLIGIEARNTPPSINAAIKIANYLEVSTDYLLGMEEKDDHTPYNELHCDPIWINKSVSPFAALSDSQDREFLELYSKLTTEERKIILDLIKKFVSKNE